MKNLILFIASALIASSFFCFSALNAQIVYTDVDPDTTVYMPDTIGRNDYYFDLNHDSIDDFWVYAEKGQLATYPYSYYWFTGIYSIDSVNKVLTAPKFYNDTINNNLSYWLNDIQIRAYVSGNNGGTWYNNVSQDSFAYCGLKFIKNNLTYFGWIHLKAYTSQYFIVDDYAYNTIPEQPIVCGQIISSAKSLDVNESIIISTSNNNLVIKVSDTSLLGKTVNIYTNAGTLLKTIKITNMQSNIPLGTQPGGIYLIEINTAEGSYSKKIYINSK